MTELNKRWLVIGWQDGQPIMLLNGKPRVYHDLKHALQGFALFAPRTWQQVGRVKRWRPVSAADNTNRIVELTFTDEGVTGTYVK